MSKRFFFKGLEELYAASEGAGIAWDLPSASGEVTVSTKKGECPTEFSGNGIAEFMAETQVSFKLKGRVGELGAKAKTATIDGKLLADHTRTWADIRMGRVSPEDLVADEEPKAKRSRKRRSTQEAEDATEQTPATSDNGTPASVPAS